MSSLWDKKYEPKDLDGFVCLDKHRKKFQKIIDERDVKVVRFLYGGPGFGKTTIANILMRQVKAQCKVINGSDKTSVDDIRGDVSTFSKTASTVPGIKKIIFIDEGDRLSTEAKDAMKKLIVDVADKCSFIIATNRPEAFESANLSRVDRISLIPTSKEETKELQKAFYMRAKFILDSEKVKFPPKTLQKLIMSVYPDFRQIIIQLQMYYDVYGEINDGILDYKTNTTGSLLNALREKVTNNEMIAICNEVEPIDFFYSFQEGIANYLTNDSVRAAYEIFGFYNSSHGVAINKKTSLACCMIELLNADLKFEG